MKKLLYFWLVLSLSANALLIITAFNLDGQRFAYRDAFNSARSTLEGYLRTQGKGINSSFVCRDVFPKKEKEITIE